MTNKPIAPMSRRTFLAGSSAIGALALTGVRPAMAQDLTIPAPIAPIEAGAKFRWIDSGDDKANFYRQFFPKYAELRDIEIVYDPLPWGDISQVVPLGIRNQTAHDVFVLPANLSSAYAVAEGWVQPYDDYIPDIEAWKANFPDGAFIEGLNVFDGKTYGMPITDARSTNAHLLFNRDYVAEAGYDPEATPLTWDSMRDCAMKITQNKKGRAFGFIIGGNQVARWGDCVRTMASMAGTITGDTGFFYGVDFTTGEPAFDSDEFVGAVELLLAMKADGSVFPGVLSLNAPQARAMMPQGAAGLILQGPWNIPAWERESPNFNFGIAPTPGPEGATGNLIIPQLGAAGNTMWLYKNSQNPQIAADIFHYLGTPEGQVTWGQYVGVGDPPIFPAARAAAKVSERSSQALAMFEKFIKIGPNPLVRNPAMGEVAKVYREPTPNLSQTVQGLFTGQLSGVKEQLTKVNDATNAALDAAFAEAKAAGADVSRDQLVFGNWRPDQDYVAADYAAL